MFKTITPLHRRVIVFMCSFVIISGAIGPRVINGGIVGRGHFDIYGSLGKMVLFGLIAFLLLARRRRSVSLRPWRLWSLWWFVASAAALTAAWLGIGKLLHGNQAWLLATHLSLLLSVAFAGVGSFGLANCRILLRAYRQELWLAFGAGATFLVLLTGIYSTWSILAAGVLHSVQFLLNLSGIETAIIPPRTLLLDKFGITIAQYCSGIESLALFSGLYAIIGFLDWSRLSHRKFLWLFPAALVGLFICNILRVFGLILGGYYFNPQIAFSLFHTYAGMLFFILYAAIFWKVSYSWMLRKR